MDKDYSGYIFGAIFLMLLIGAIYTTVTFVPNNYNSETCVETASGKTVCGQE